MTIPRLAACACLTWFAIGCSSSSSDANTGGGGKTSSGGAASAGTSGSSAGGSSGSSAGGATATGGSAGTSAGTAGTATAGSGGSGGTTGGSGGTATSGSGGMGTGGVPADASDFCKDYCKCHEDNCSTTAIPTGESCWDFCASWEADETIAGCRMNMCNLVPAQPDNDHCTHSVGTGQCPP